MGTHAEGLAAAERLREYWTTGKGGLAIRWGEPHDFDRCVSQIRRHTNMTDPEGYCNKLHQRALGHPPGKGH